MDADGRVLTVSIVVCTHNPRLDYFARTIAAILPQMRNIPGRELLIVDNASRVAVAGLPVAQQAGVQVIVEPRLGLTAARECAARHARHELIVFVDDDNVLSADYLDRAVELFGDSTIGVLSGDIRPEYEVTPAVWFSRFEEAIAIRKLPDDTLYLTKTPAYTRLLPIGAGCTVRRGLLCAYFDALSEDLRIEGRRGAELSAGEDIDLALFALSEGFQVGCSGALHVTHLIPARRVQAGYIAQLNQGALRSAMLVNAKWRKRFGCDVFPFLSQPKWQTILKAAAYGLLSFQTEWRLRCRIQLDLLRLRP